MAVHDVKLSLPATTAIPVGPVDHQLVVRRDGAMLGTMTFSQGGIDWRPARKQKSYGLSWAEFDAVMQGNGTLR